MWRKGNPHALWVGLQIGTATMENTMEVPQKIKNRTVTKSSNSASGYLSKETRDINSIRYTHSYVTAALLVTAELRNQPGRPPVEAWIQETWCIHTMNHYWATPTKLVICDDVDGHKGHHAT